jgi:hypothetical protein
VVYVVDAKINASDKDLPVTRGRLALTNNLICVCRCSTLNFSFVSISFAQLLLVLAESLLAFSTQLAEQDQPMRDQHH